MVKPQQRDIHIDILKGVSILAVIGLHYLSSLEWTTFTTSPYRHLAIAVNQILRFSVPLFIAISGYLLTQKYTRKSLDLPSYFLNRFLAIIPLYLLWSLLISLALHTPITLGNLLYGRTDYHLYFVPMIIGLYTLYPLIHAGFRISPVLTLVGAILIQSLRFVTLSSILEQPGIPVLSDYEQYLNPFSWIFYLVLGSYVARVSILSNYRRLFGFVLLVGVVVSAYWSWWRALTLQTSGVDIIVTGRFTTFPVMVYASLFIAGALWYGKIFTYLPRLISQFLAFAGKYSYLLYLSHTLFLRLIMLPLANSSIMQRSIIFIAYLGAVFVSILITKQVALMRGKSLA
jgi:probable poly-beta-1,6-N-acetyl-D-glucosamine export protein